MFYLLLADALLVIHVLFVVYMIGGLLLTLTGKLLHWSWVYNPWFRWSHLVGIGIVVLQSWLGVLCPLTIWEMQLRQSAGAATYSGAFIAHWLQQLLYFQAPWWVFTASYSIFGLLVVFSWFWVRPRSFSPQTKSPPD